jgi:hypothetical protein
MQELAPIVLFVYNRPEHTLETLKSLKNNELASGSKLYVFADGPKTGASKQDMENISKVREIVKSEKWCGEVEIRESEKNKGLANSIIAGVTEIVNQYGHIIILEDDLQLSPGFLKYMNNALGFYEEEKRVMHIAGFTPPFKGQMPETFFFPVPTCWGWATWKRAWDHFNPSAEDLLPKVLKKGKWKFDFRRSINYVRMLKRNMHGRVNSWFIRWYASIFLKNGLCLHPGKSLVNNIGLDRTGVNSYKSNVFDQEVAQDVMINNIQLKFNKRVVRKYRRFNWKVKLKHFPEYFQRVITKNTDT